MFCLSLLVSLVGASTVGLCGIPLVILDCKVPPDSHAYWIANRSTIVKKGKMNTNDSNFALVGNDNLKIVNTSDAYLHYYRCEIWPPSDYVREFPLLGGCLFIYFDHILSGYV